MFASRCADASVARHSAAADGDASHESESMRVPLLTGYATFVPRTPFLALTQGAMPAYSPRGKRCRMRDRNVADVRALVGSGMAQPLRRRARRRRVSSPSLVEMDAGS